jgi:hypothetical protein
MKSTEFRKLIREEIRKVLREDNTPTHTITVYDSSQVDYIVDDLKAAGALVLTIESPDNDETFVDVAMSDQQLRKFQSEWGMANAKDDWSVEAL